MRIAEIYKALLLEAGFSHDKRKKTHIGQFMHTPFFDIHEIQGLIREDKRNRGKEQIYLELKAPVEDVEIKLTNLENVEKVERLKTNGDDLKKFTIECTKGVDLREKLFRLAVENNWVLLEMRQKQASLEDVFRQLTTS